MNAETQNHFERLAAVNVNSHIEKKNGLSYLSWAWAVDQIMRQDPEASWEFQEPRMFGETMMVYCTVTAFGKPRTAFLPVMDYKNKPIHNPDAFAVNTAMQRCLVKAIALHGLGLYIYAGEDVPEGATDERETEQKPRPSVDPAIVAKLRECTTIPALQAAWVTLTKEQMAAHTEVKNKCKEFILSADVATQA